jgi:serine protease Do
VAVGANGPGPHGHLKGPPIARGEYADSFQPLSEQVRAFERDPANRYTYCIRAPATFECLSYGAGGDIRHQQRRSVAHGTGFGFREQGGETMLLTNSHVITWPRVTDPRSSITDVPAGCKLVAENLQIVDNEQDDYSSDDIPPLRVGTDDELDAAVVKAKVKLRIIPYRIGRSLAVVCRRAARAQPAGRRGRAGQRRGSRARDGRAAPAAAAH